MVTAQKEGLGTATATSQNSLYPKISIVTPSYNQGQYIEETILSVVNQNYPNLEYIIIDGSSTDNTIEVIKKYEQHIAYWESEPDNGQAHAINKGFKKATGDILAWINSDDYYEANIFNFIVNSININKTMLLYGNASYYFQNSMLFKKVDVVLQKEKKVLPFDLGFIQPSTFWTAKLWEQAGELDESLHFAFDLDWYLRCIEKATFVALDKQLAIYRIHDNHKTASGGASRANEILKALQNNNFKEYAEALKSIDLGLADKISALDFKYGLGKVIYPFYRLMKPSLRAYKNNEVAQLFTKARNVF